MTLYKYTSVQAGINIIRTRELRFSQMNSLNDPFESHLPVDGLLTDQAIEGWFEFTLSNSELLDYIASKTIDDMYSKLLAKATQPIPRAMFEEYLAAQLKTELTRQGKTSLIEYVKEELGKQMPQIIQRIRSNFPNDVAGELGALSLTEIPNNEIMWSHYADSYAGIVLGFDANDNFFANVFKIRYQNERPKLDLKHLSAPDVYFKEKLQSFCGVKNEVWSYEQEYRLVEPIRALRDSGVDDAKGVRIYTKPFSPSSLQTLIFGGRITEETKVKLKTELALPEFQHVRLSSAETDKTKNRVIIVDI